MFRKLLHKMFLLLLACFVLLLVFFSIANRHDVTLNLNPLPWELSLPLFALMLFCVGLGYAWGSFGRITAHISRTAQQRQLLQQKAASETELAALKAEMLLHKSEKSASNANNAPAQPVLPSAQKSS